MANLRERILALPDQFMNPIDPLRTEQQIALAAARMALDELSNRMEDTTDAPHHVIRDMRHELADDR